MKNAATRAGKAFKKRQEYAAVVPLTKAEINVLTVNFPKKSALRLGTGEEIRWEMKRIYRATVEGKLPLSAATKLLYMLDKIAKSRSEDEKLKILERGGIAGAPFVGLMLAGPRE